MNNHCFDNKKKLISIKKAKKIILGECKVSKYHETIDINDCVGRVVFQDIKSQINVPPHNNSAVDGYGFNFEDYKKNRDKKFKIVGSSKPGKPFNRKISSGELIEIFTGAPILKKCNQLQVDTVIMEEDVSNTLNNSIKLPSNIKKGSNIRLFGEDIKKNDKIYNKGRKIRPLDIGYLASVGISKIKVFKRIKVGIFSTGNEISDSKYKKKFQIFDSNKLTLIFLLKKIGCEILDLGIIYDDYNESKKKILDSTKKCDLIITTGGISTGKTDNISKVLQVIGQLDVWRLAVKPGRPMAFGKVKAKPFFGLPGNPVAVVLTFLMFVTEFIRKMNGRTVDTIKYNLIPSSFSFEKKVGRTEWLRGNVVERKSNLFLEKFYSEGSGILSSVARTEGIIEIESNKKSIKKGELLKFYKYEEFLN